MANTKKLNNEKASTKAPETKAPKTKAPKEKKVETKNVEKKNVTLNMEQVVKELETAGIKVYNPQAKGNYRIFGSKKGSSLNLQKAQYIIFSTDDDFKAVKDAKVDGVELTEKGNSQDKSRPNVVKFTTEAALKAVLKIYAKNPVNQIAKA